MDADFSSLESISCSLFSQIRSGLASENSNMWTPVHLLRAGKSTKGHLVGENI
jgi:hypothetical protein